MNHQWQLTRSFEARPDGQRRWDYAYQHLLHWAIEQSADSLSASSHLQEVHHANRNLRSRLKSTSTATPKH
jgi:hypothetical protein